MKLLLLPTIFSLLLNFGQNPPAKDPHGELTATPTSVKPGGMVTLRWKTQNATAVYLSGVGKVEPNGSRILKVSYTQTFVLIFENEKGAISAVASVEVKDAPLDKTFPTEQQQFKDLQTFTYRGKSRVPLLDRILRVFKDEMRLDVREYRGNRRHTFITARSERGVLRRRKDRQEKIRKRAISYRVVVFWPNKVADGPNQPSEYTYTLSSWNQYFDAGEKAWGTEEDEAAYGPAIDKLRASLAPGTSTSKPGRRREGRKRTMRRSDL